MSFSKILHRRCKSLCNLGAGLRDEGFGFWPSVQRVAAHTGRKKQVILSLRGNYIQNFAVEQLIQAEHSYSLKDPALTLLCREQHGGEAADLCKINKRNAKQVSWDSHSQTLRTTGWILREEQVLSKQGFWYVRPDTMRLAGRQSTLQVYESWNQVPGPQPAKQQGSRKGMWYGLPWSSLNGSNPISKLLMLSSLPFRATLWECATLCALNSDYLAILKRATGPRASNIISGARQKMLTVNHEVRYTNMTAEMYHP